MYTILLVDDEEDVMRVMMKKLNWEEMGFSVVGTAGNGVKALEMVEEFQPDVVMTDIKMPYMDGMELSKRIKAEYPATKIILFTGFDEFEYAKEAVHLEVEEYILKPLNSTELTNIFKRLREKLDQEISEKRSAQILQEYYAASLPLLRANFYSTLIEGKLQSDEIQKYLENYQITLEGPFYCCAVIHTSTTQMPEGMSPLLLQASVQKQTEERLIGQWRAKSFNYLGNIVLLVQLHNENEVSDLTDECDRFCRYIHRIIGAVVTIGVGKACASLPELADSYSGAREAVSYRGIYGAMRAINIKEIAPGEKRSMDSQDDAELTELLKKIRLGSKKEVEESVDRYLTHTSSIEKTLLQHHIDIMELVSALYRFAENNDIADEGFSAEARTLYSRVLDMDPGGLRKWLLEISDSFSEKLASARTNSTKSFVQKAEEYVRENYADEGISLDTICEILGVSNSYFSSIYKKETGNSFISYLTNYRMEQAARLLVTTNEKSYIIAKQVGYSDSNYFSYVFKRRFGTAPSKYRTEHTKG